MYYIILPSIFVQNINQMKYQYVTLLVRFLTIFRSVNKLCRYLTGFIKKML